jgi:hypothetical protein
MSWDLAFTLTNVFFVISWGRVHLFMFVIRKTSAVEILDASDSTIKNDGNIL